MRKSKAFTLIEIVVVIGLISFFVGISVPFLQKVKIKNDLRSATVIMVQSLRRAQILAQSGTYDKEAGVYIQSGIVTVFRGPNYLERDSDFDDNYTLPLSVSLEGIQQIVFAKTTGYPDTTGPIIILTSNEGNTSTLSINSKGIVEY